METDCELLEAIKLKYLADATVNLQWMHIHFQDYDRTIKYRPHHKIHLPDALSQYTPWQGQQIPLDAVIHPSQITDDLKVYFQDAYWTNSSFCAFVGTDAIYTPFTYTGL